MRAVIQRVRRASVSVEADGFHSEIGCGFAVLLGVGSGDGEADCRYIARKTAGLRVFEDGEGKMNRSLADVGGEVLLVSQFTLYGDCRRGRRPSFAGAAAPDDARVLYERVAELLQDSGVTVKTGLFRRRMLVETVNEGPVTLLLDSGGDL